MNPIPAQPSSVAALITELEGQFALSEAATDASLAVLDVWRSRAQLGSEKRESDSQELNRMLSEVLESSRVALERAMNLLVSISSERRQLHQHNSSELRDAQDSVEKLEILPRTLDVKALGEEVRSSMKEMQASIKQAIALEHELIAMESKCSGFRELWENVIGDLRLSITRKVDTFKETTDVFDEQSREFKSVMKSALDLCRNA